jgi:hypothetical protein
MSWGSRGRRFKSGRPEWRTGGHGIVVDWFRQKSQAMVKWGLTEGKNPWRLGATTPEGSILSPRSLGRSADPGGHRLVVPLVSRGVCYRVVAAREGRAMGEKLKAAFQRWRQRHREASGF